MLSYSLPTMEIVLKELKKRYSVYWSCSIDNLYKNMEVKGAFDKDN
jgi:5'(3')-deoxyribonucleotidase